MFDSTASSSGGGAMEDVYRFGSSQADGEGEGFSFRSDAQAASSGYLDDPSPSSSSSVTHTSLFAQLAQRQHLQQQGRRNPALSQADYDDPAQWRSRSHSRSISEEDSEDDDESSYDSEALQKEWDEQVEQMKLMFQIIVFPFVGKFFGRKFAYFLFDRYKSLGTPFSAAFWRGKL